MPDTLVAPPADLAARERALDIRSSVLVQAPAGSGKTELLTRRFLRLLAVVDEPEEILAITFTRAATAEMRNRILSDLQAVAGSPVSPGEIERLGPAQEAWAHAERRGWDLLRQPQRLLIETIDSLCLRIAYDRPLLAGLGGRLQPVDDATLLYHEAARRTLDRLGTSDPALDAGLAHLLDLRDNRLQDCGDLLAGMLERRDQWLHAFPSPRAMTEEDWDQLRAKLQTPFQHQIHRVTSEAHRLLMGEPQLADELLMLGRWAAEHGNEKLGLLASLPAISESMSFDHWLCIHSLLLTNDDEWRRRVNALDGFPPGPAGSENAEHKRRMSSLLERLRWLPRLLSALGAIRELPPAAYTEEQWTTLRHLFTVLRQAIAELRVVFAEKNTVDFTEVSLAAIEVLEHAPDRLLAIGGNLRHLLVDEFQDTSRIQHKLVTLLISAWDPHPDEHRSVFLVGDPMQSIYMFRQAEVELFTHVREHGIGNDANCIRCEPVHLSVNFRSHAGLTDPLNGMFSRICAGDPPPGSAAVAFASAAARDPAPPEPALHVHPQILGAPDRHPGPDEAREAQQREANEVLRILEQHLPAMEAARAEGKEYRIAVLVRARPHLAQLVPLLRRRGIPFRAVEIERLSERQELLDLLSLTRALLHPMDRIAWLAVLRAPWCGLTLDDLHRLTGVDNPSFKKLSVLELIELHQHLLSPDGQRRLMRTAEILRRALELRWRQAEIPSFASWIERTWRTLAGPACLDAAADENAQVFFSLLDALPPDGLAPFTGEFAAELDRLFAQPDPSVSDTCGIQLMTIHKAKGLGFDVVLVPGLDRASSGDDNPLVCALERIDPGHPGETEFLVAPIGLHGENTEPLYRWVRRQRQMRFDEERKRLFYVACTRARRELHLFGTAVNGASGLNVPNKDSLLKTAWPALHDDFEIAAREPQPVAAPRVLAFPAPGVLRELAAAAGPVSAPSPRRLLLDAEPLPREANVTAAGTLVSGSPDAPDFHRPEGSRQARLIGSTVHTLLQRLGPHLSALPPADLRTRAASLFRAAALTGDTLSSATAAVAKLLRACAADPVCQWILAAHPDAQSEASWSGFLAQDSGARLRTLRADRVFRAGPVPLADGTDVFWVIDYKTSPGPSGALFLAQQRTRYAPQLEAYGRVLRALHGQAIPLRLGLYYPASALLDYWDPATG